MPGVPGWSTVVSQPPWTMPSVYRLPVQPSAFQTRRENWSWILEFEPSGSWRMARSWRGGRSMPRSSTSRSLVNGSASTTWSAGTSRVPWPTENVHVYRPWPRLRTASSRSPRRTVPGGQPAEEPRDELVVAAADVPLLVRAG